MTEIVEKLRIVNVKGLHARASAKFVETLERYHSTVRVQRDDMKVTGRSIMGLLMLGASQGTNIIVTISGQDSQECFNALKNLIDSGFGEETVE